MTRNIPQKIRDQLFSISGGRCQNPKCNEKIIDLKSSKFRNIGEVAHKEGYSSDGPRGNSDNKYDNSFENLLVLCPNCHTKIDKSPQNYDVELLNKWKEISLNKYKGLLTPDLIWNQISFTTKKKIEPSLLLNGREKQVEELLEKLNEGGQKIEIKSDSMLESYLFILATLRSNNFENIISIVVSNMEEFNDIINGEEEKKLTIIPIKGFIPSNIGTIIEQGHNIVLYSGKELLHNICFDKTINLGVMDRLLRISALKDIVGDENIATQIYRDTKGYLFPILRHYRLDLNDNLIPEWYRVIDKNVLLTIFLITEWKEDTDKELIKYLSGKEYDEFLEILYKLEKKDDSPIRKISDIWQLISKNDLRPFIEENINDSILTRFKFVSEIALSELDPRAELPPSERWMANVITDERPEFSLRSKKGLSDSLALLGTLNNSKIENIVESIVITILNSEKNVSKLLNSLGYNIQNIAEANPAIFLNYIDTNIDNLGGIFEQGDILMGGDGVFIHLLWSLEKLSWSTEYITRVVHILFKLTEKYESNIRNNYSNRPSGTLSEIFLPWINNTFLDIDKRIELLNSIPNKDILFSLLIKLFNNSSSSGLAKPIYQNWNTDMPNVTNKDYIQYIQGIINILLEIFQNDIEKNLYSILDVSTDFTIEGFNKLLDILLKYDFSKIQDINIINSVLQIIEKKLYDEQIYGHNSILSINNNVEKFKSLYNLVISNNNFNYNIGLFNIPNKVIISQLDEYSKEPEDWKKNEKILYNKRIEVINKIYKEKGFEGILEIVDKLNNQNFIVKSIIESGLKNELFEHIFQLLDSNNINFINFSKTLIRQLDYLDDKLIQSKILYLSTFKSNLCKVNFLLGLSLNTRVLKILKNDTEETKKIFWENFGKEDLFSYFHDKDYSELNYYISELNRFGLTYIAFNEIGMFEHNEKLNYLDNNLIIETLEKLVYFINKKIGFIQFLEFRLKQILNYLYNELDKGKIIEGKIFNIEVIYINIIENPKIINGFVEKNPKLFTELICNVFKPHNGLKEDVSDKEKNIAKNSYEILRKINKIPGYKNGKIDYNILRDWIRETIIELKDKDRYEVGSEKIGELLTNCGKGDDGIWPSNEVREIIEKESNEYIIRGFLIGKRNSRGVTSRGIYDGGKQERILAEKFYSDAEKIKSSYNKTAQILRKIGDMYIKDGEMLDDNVKLDL